VDNFGYHATEMHQPAQTELFCGFKQLSPHTNQTSIQNKIANAFYRGQSPSIMSMFLPDAFLIICLQNC